MKIFEQFPIGLQKCPICGTNDKGKSVLLKHKDREEFVPTHLECIELEYDAKYDENIELIFQRINKDC